ncbi:MAG: STAS domain-containing protein [Dehalococcoidia bacterium]
MITPILTIGDVLLVSIQEDLSDDEIIELQDQIITRVSESRAEGLVIEISAIDMVDSYMARVLNDISMMVGVLGSQTVITGMQPAVAITLVDMGSELIGVKTALNLENGLEEIQSMIDQRRKETNHVALGQGVDE